METLCRRRNSNAISTEDTIMSCGTGEKGHPVLTVKVFSTRTNGKLQGMEKEASPKGPLASSRRKNSI